MAEPVLQVEGLTKRFGKFVAVRDLSFTISAGEVVGFLGQNGAGKSTTIKILCNLIAPSEGQIRLNGESIVGRRSGAHRARLGVIVEAPRFYPHLSGRRNLQMLAEIHGVPPEKAAELLVVVGLEERQGELFGRFSMGMKQRLGLAAVFLNDPTLIVLDEPTTGLDPVGRQQIHDLIHHLTRERKVSALLCTHLLSEVEALCDRALVLHRGELIMDQSLKTKGGMAEVERCFQNIAEQLTAKGELG